MVQTVDLDQYIRMGGDVSRLDVKQTRVTHLKHKDLAISSIFDLGKNGNNVQLFDVYFVDGANHRYAGMWIETKVYTILHAQYFT